MDLQSFFENFEVIAEAPGGVQKLRSLILDLAVRGKLVPQDAKDEPAEVLHIIEHGEVYELPEHWQFVELGQVIQFVNGFAFKSADFQTHGLGVVRIGNLVNGAIDPTSMNCVQPDYLSKLDAKFQVHPGDLLIAMSGATTGKLAFNTTNNIYLLNQRVGKIIPIKIHPEYLYYFLNTQIKKNLEASFGSAIPNLSTQYINSIPTPLPPFAEQKRIVAKVDELMALCDRYEAAKQTRDNLRQKLRGSAIDALMNADSDETLGDAWAIVQENWLDLSQEPQDVDDLRKLILELAVRGKLVPQDASDGNASDFQESSKKTKQQLTASGQIKKSKPLGKIPHELIVHEIPKSWQWSWLDDISDIGTGSTPLTSNPDYYEGGNIPWITSTSTSQDFIAQAENFVTDLAVKDHRLRMYQPGCLIVALYGQGKTRGQISGLKIAATINQACAAITLLDATHEHQEYIRYVFKKKYEELRSLAAGGAQPNLNVGKIKETLIPLPPLPEQKRIVTKVEQLTTLCDTLEDHLRDAQAKAKALAAAAVSQLVI
ncbi:MAG: hypothetical protein HC860_05930 [Alkalinema sp. RU_4_3]|nr:hypothetical protein [Alkalinema sp. RU_4_3]